MIVISKLVTCMFLIMLIIILVFYISCDDYYYCNSYMQYTQTQDKTCQV